MILAIIWTAWAVVNLIVFCLYGADKRRAKKDAWRNSGENAADRHMADGRRGRVYCDACVPPQNQAYRVSDQRAGRHGAQPCRDGCGDGEASEYHLNKKRGWIAPVSF